MNSGKLLIIQSVQDVFLRIPRKISKQIPNLFKKGIEEQIYKGILVLFSLEIRESFLTNPLYFFFLYVARINF